MTTSSVLPSSEATLLVRTAFDDEAAWTSLVERVGTPSPDGFLADVEVVDVGDHRDLTAEQLRADLDRADFAGGTEGGVYRGT